MKPKPLIYIAAPYRSDPIGNTRRAVNEGMALWHTGLVAVLIPHLTIVADIIAPMSANDWYGYDFDLVPHCSAVFRLSGDSEGADRECELARIHKIPVFTDRDELVAWATGWVEAAAPRIVDGDPEALAADDPDRLPSLRLLARRMLETGDMVWSEADQWFYRCPCHCVLPVQIGQDAGDEYLIALYPSAAEDWNRAQRAGRLA